MACCIVVFLGPFHIIGIAAALSRRLRTKPIDPAVFHHFAIIFGIIQLFHVSLVDVAIVVLFIIPWFTTWDPGNVTPAVAVYGTLLWVS